MSLRRMLTAVVVAGDIAVFLAFVIFGKTEHEITLVRSLFRTALPFGFVWIIVSSWLGAYKMSTIYNFGAMLWKMPLIWLLCGVVALVGRVLLTGESLVLSFAIVSLVVQGVLIIGWRITFMLVVTRLVREPLN